MAKDPNRMPSPWDDPNQEEDTQNQNPDPVGGQQSGTSGTQTAEAPQQAPAQTPAVTPGYNRTKFQDAWGAMGSHTANDLTNLIKDHPEFATGVTRNSADKVTMPAYTEEGTGYQRGPENLDLIQDVGGINHEMWGGYGEGSAEATPPPQSAVPPSAYTPAPSAAQSASAPPAPAQGADAPVSPVRPWGPEASPSVAPEPKQPAKSQYDDVIHAAIQKMLGQGDVSENDPTIKAQFEPVARTLQRGAQRTREQAAERLAQQGLNNGGSGGALDAEVNSINEGEAGQEGTLMSTLVGRELDARRQDIVNALGVAQGEEKLQLTQQLAALDRQLEQSKMAQQNTQFGQSQAQQESQFGRSQAQTGSQFDRTLAQGGSQFDRNLAYMLQQLQQSGSLASQGLDIQRSGQNNQNQQFYDSFGRQIGRDQVNDDQWMYDRLTA